MNPTGEPLSPHPPQPPRADLRALGRRYAGVLTFGAAIALLLALVPSVAPPSSSGALLSSDGGFPSTVPGAGSLPGTATTKPDQSARPGTNAGNPTVGGSVPVPGSLGGGQVVAKPACEAGARVLPFSHYATTCVPSFTGSNGGATSFGVTGDTITLSYRVSDSGEAAALAAASPSLKASQTDYLKDLQTFAAYFNKKFQLYGRHVVIKGFTGRGDWVSEYQGQNLAGAQSDADTARGLGAFADISSESVGTTPPYAQYLANNKIISIGGVSASQSFFQSYAPYVYTAGTSVTNTGDWMSGLICDRLKGLPAIFAGDSATKARTRVFGMIIPDNPDFSPVGDAIQRATTACGSGIAKTYHYSLNLSTLASDSGTAMAQMRSAGVTTVLCACDTVSPKFFTQSADSQQYHPEWLGPGGDSFGQGYSQTQWAHALSMSGTYLPDDKTEAHTAFQAAAPGARPAESFYAVAYRAAVLLFDALQAAGPNLNPASFQRGFFGLPPSAPGGEYGSWLFGHNRFTTDAGAPLGWYDPNAVSSYNGTKGAWVSCAGADGREHPWSPASGYGPPGTQLHCFGK